VRLLIWHQLFELAMLVEFELIESARSGNDTAFNQIVLAYRKRILGTISRLIGRPEDVEDVAQEVFLRLYFSLDQLRTAEVFEPWLYRLHRQCGLRLFATPAQAARI